MPLKRRSHRHRNRKYEWAVGVFLVFVGLWALGLRIHSDAIPTIGSDQNIFWRLVHADGSSYVGKIIFRTKDAVTLDTVSGRATVMQPDILKLDPLSHREVKKLREQGVIEADVKQPWITWRKEDIIFHNLLGSGRQGSGKSSNSVQEAIMSQALKSMPSEGVAGVSKDKIMKAYREGKIDPKTIQSKMKNLDPKTAAEYRKKAMTGIF